MKLLSIMGGILILFTSHVKTDLGFHTQLQIGLQKSYDLFQLSW